jgi:hypothetical protein
LCHAILVAPKITAASNDAGPTPRRSIMKSAIITAATASALAAGALGFAGDAKAVPLEGSAADQAVASLQARGFNVQINGATSSSLSRCTVTSINGLRGTESGGRPLDENVLTTVFVSVDCLH